VQRRAALVIAIALVALAGLTGPVLAAGAKSSPTRAFSAGGVSFRYPAAWKTSPAAWRWKLTFSSLVTYLATQPMHDPCSTSGNSTTCAPPFGALVPGGILVTWTHLGTPGWSLAKQPGKATTLAGRHARVQIARPGACRYLGASETVTAQVALASSNSVQMQACLRGSTAKANEARVLAMLASLRIRS
jgi:hypothetical protein